MAVGSFHHHVGVARIMVVNETSENRPAIDENFHAAVPVFAYECWLSTACHEKPASFLRAKILHDVHRIDQLAAVAPERAQRLRLPHHIGGNLIRPYYKRHGGSCRMVHQPVISTGFVTSTPMRTDGIRMALSVLRLIFPDKFGEARILPLRSNDLIHGFASRSSGYRISHSFFRVTVAWMSRMFIKSHQVEERRFAGFSTGWKDAMCSIPASASDRS